ncbi:MAG: cysteine desulfurase family protein [bacterium JZ-2024 1]
MGNNEKRKRIYLDYAATTPLDERVFQEMAPYFHIHFGNPSSTHHFGTEARQAVEEARKQVALAMEAQDSEIIFTSGGTEANNLALIGFCLANREKGNHILISAIEHHSVLEPAEFLHQLGFQVEKIPPNSEGVVEIEAVQKRVRKDTILISVMHANNEVGTIQPVEEIGAWAKERGIAFHTDAVQSFGLLPVSVQKFHCDLLSVSSHKIYGPKGVGALYCKNGVSLHPLLLGGGQEHGLRSGTENVPAIVGFGKACSLLLQERQQRVAHLLPLREFLVAQVQELFPFARVTSKSKKLLPHIVHFLFPGVDGQALLHALDYEGFAVSLGSACQAGAPQPSSVLLAMGLSPPEALSALRISLGISTTKNDLQLFLEALRKILRRMGHLTSTTATPFRHR